MKTLGALCRCSYPVRSAPGLSAVPCGGLANDTPEGRRRHTRDVHGLDMVPEATFTAMPGSGEEQQRGAAAYICECGARKVKGQPGCAACRVLDAQHPHVPREPGEDAGYDESLTDLVPRTRNRDAQRFRRVLATERGVCVMCFKASARPALKTCESCVIKAMQRKRDARAAQGS